MCWIMISYITEFLCRIGLHRFKYWHKNMPYGGVSKFRQCRCCLVKWKWVNISYEFRVNSRTGKINQPKSKWKWKVIKPSIEDIRQIRLKKLGI